MKYPLNNCILAFVFQGTGTLHFSPKSAIRCSSIERVVFFYMNLKGTTPHGRRIIYVH